MKKRLAAKVLGTVATISILSGCAADTKNNTDNLVLNNTPVIVIEYTDQETKVAETIKEVKYAGTHYITYHVYYNYFENDDPRYIYNSNFEKESGFIDANVPYFEGYAVYDVEPITALYGHGSKTVGFEYFLVNNEDVEVIGELNIETGKYDFNNPGTPIRGQKLELDLG